MYMYISAYGSILKFASTFCFFKVVSPSAATMVTSEVTDTQPHFPTTDPSRTGKWLRLGRATWRTRYVSLFLRFLVYWSIISINHLLG